MYFKTTETRLFWLAILTYIIIDIFISIIISWYFNTNFWFTIIAIIILFQVIIPLLNLFRSIIYWIIFYRIIRNTVRDAFFSELISHNFPEPRDVENSVSEYFDFVVSHNVINKKALLLSMFYMGYVKCLNDTFKLIYSSAFTAGLELAIVKYKELKQTNISKKNDENKK